MRARDDWGNTMIHVANDFKGHRQNANRGIMALELLGCEWNRTNANGKMGNANRGMAFAYSYLHSHLCISRLWMSCDYAIRDYAIANRRIAESWNRMAFSFRDVGIGKHESQNGITKHESQKHESQNRIPILKSQFVFRDSNIPILHDSWQNPKITELYAIR